MATRAADYLAEPERKEQPWALCVGLITPHFPLIVREKYWNMYYPRHADLPDIPEGHLESLHPQNKRLREYFGLEGATEEQTRRGRAAYYGLVTFADERIGQVLDALERNGLAENTVVVYVSDHGEMMGEHGLWWKCTYYEGSSRIPFIVSWPKQFEPGRRTAITSLVDLTRTVIDLAGCEVERRRPRRPSPDRPAQRHRAGRRRRRLLGVPRPTAPTAPSRMVRTRRLQAELLPRRAARAVRRRGRPRRIHRPGEDPAYAAVREELMALVLATGTRTGSISRARESQRLRRIVVEGSPHLSFEHWEPADDNWEPLAVLSVAATD